VVSREVEATAAHRSWTGILNAVIAGDEVTITRYHQPIAIVVKLDKWNALQAELATLRERVRVLEG
jgi:antitoxin (DNA-binding transcriptional repressor) of toxin-antitoxin stability system